MISTPFQLKGLGHYDAYWVNTTSVPREVNDLYISYRRVLLLEVAYGVREVYEGLSPYWPH